MFGNLQRIINLLTEMKVTTRLLYDEVALYRSEQQRWREEDLARLRDERDENLARYMQWHDENKQLAKENTEQAIAYARERDEAQMRFMQEAQATDHQAIYRKMEAERKAAARANKKNKSEETTINDAV